MVTGSGTGVVIGDALAAVAREGDSIAAATERAVAEALAPLHGATPDLALVWVSGAQPDTAGRVLAAASRLLGAVTTMGCSAAGVLAGGRAVEDQLAVAVWAAVLPGASVRAFHLETLRTEDSHTVLGMPERRHDDAVAVLFADPWSFPADGFVGGSGSPRGDLPITGTQVRDPLLGTTCDRSLGTLAGAAVGSAAAVILDRARLIRMPGDVYFLDYLPFAVPVRDLAVIVAVTLLWALACSWYGASRVAQLDPMAALRS